MGNENFILNVIEKTEHSLQIRIKLLKRRTLGFITYNTIKYKSFKTFKILTVDHIDLKRDLILLSSVSILN